jgi:hypothetical protein
MQPGVLRAPRASIPVLRPTVLVIPIVPAIASTVFQTTYQDKLDDK